jgi:hypothetical protein
MRGDYSKIGDRLAHCLARHRRNACVCAARFPRSKPGDCLFEAYIPAESLVRGDACLPNSIVGDDGVNGRIDLGDPGVGQIEDDLSAAVWRV